MALVFTTGDTLWATPNHPFWHSGGYVEAEHLRPGDTLVAVNGTSLIIANSFTKDTTLRVYNFTVEDNHNYYVGDPGVLVHNNCFLEKIQDWPELVAEIKKLPKGLRSKFIEDFYNASDDVLKAFKGNPGCGRAWEKSTEFVNVRKDIDFLKSFSRALEDNTLAKPPINIESRINDWIKNSHLKCKTCPTGTEPYLDEVLDNVYEIKEHLSKPGALVVLDQIGSSSTKAEGANWLMKFVKEKKINPSAFEEIISDERKFTADIIVDLPGGEKIYFECKSWESSMQGLFTTGRTNFCDQLLNYIHNPQITKLEQFGFYFNPGKWTPSANDLNKALKANKKLFGKSRWETYRELFQFSDFQVSKDNIDKLIDFITENKFNDIIKS